MIRFPIRKSPCTITGGDGGGWFASEPAQRPLERGRGVADRVELLAPDAHLVLLSAGRRLAGSTRWIAASACAHCSSSRGRGGVVELAEDSRGDRLAVDEVADQKRLVGDQHMRHRRALLRPPAACVFASICHRHVHVVGRPDAQDQFSAVRVERPRGPACSAGQCAQIVDGDALAEHRRQHAAANLRRACVVAPATRRCGWHSGARSRRLSSRHLRSRPNLNSRCATRRIWISSDPSVMR